MNDNNTNIRGGSGIVVTEEPDINGGTIKVITAVDLSDDTVDAKSLLKGTSAHDRLGNAISGEFVPEGYVETVTDPVDVIVGDSIEMVEMQVRSSGESVDLETPENVIVRTINRGLLPGGNQGDIIIKRSSADYDTEWVAPAQSVEADNTRPITAAAVYTEIGNINALLATI